MTETTKQTNYGRRFEVKDERTYTDIDDLLADRLSHVVQENEEYTYYFLNKKRTKFVRFNRKEMTFELSDRVNVFVEEEIKKILGIK